MLKCVPHTTNLLWLAAVIHSSLTHLTPRYLLRFSFLLFVLFKNFVLFLSPEEWCFEGGLGLEKTERGLNVCVYLSLSLFPPPVVQSLLRESQVIRQTKEKQIIELKKMSDQSAESLKNEWEKKVRKG